MSIVRLTSPVSGIPELERKNTIGSSITQV